MSVEAAVIPHRRFCVIKRLDSEWVLSVRVNLIALYGKVRLNFLQDLTWHTNPAIKIHIFFKKISVSER